ncbi:predicted protein [Postia placenta Mad-698-R]|nr:predicted protein [Postia placenta Mad-698-R]
MAEAIQQLVLDTLDKSGIIQDTRTLVLPGQADAAADHESQIVILGALNSLASRDMIAYTTQETTSHVLTHEGAQIALEGSHEARVWAALPPKGQGAAITPKQLEAVVGSETAKIGQGRAFKNKWIAKEGDGLVKVAESVQDATQLEMREVDSTGTLKAGEKALAELRKRKLIVQSGSWKTSTYKKYNFEAEGLPPNGGAFHPLLKVREEIRNIFLEMGFAEMPTSSFVESGFWCFDALFVPQQHPARELLDPSTSLPPPASYYSRVSQVHEHGGYGSMGYRAPWSDAETRKLLLRTHTTASSASMLYKLAAKCRGEDTDDSVNEQAAHPSASAKEGDDGFRPAKLFSIDRVFRNETMDATHLAEFHQVEGVVADRGLTLADLIGFMRVFFKKMGIENLRFKPAYNPYTEPSLEIFAFHPQLGKWVEVGNSGMFRPEMLEPMGFPKDVHAYNDSVRGAIDPSLSAAHVACLRRYGISNIRTLVGHKVSIEGVETSPAVRF